LESICLPDTALRAIEGHKNILEAIEKNDQELLSRAISEHIEQSKQDTLRYAFQNEGEKKKKD
jgi:DNA-binding GntR family transcriptional regulator